MKQELGDSVSTKFAIHAAKRNGLGMDDWETLDAVDPRVARLIADVSTVFCCFSKKVRKLERQARRMRGPLCSEAYNHLLDEQVREVEGAFHTYMRLREELFTSIKVNSWRTRFHGRPRRVESAGAELDEQATTELDRRRLVAGHPASIHSETAITASEPALHLQGPRPASQSRDGADDAKDLRAIPT